jgi:flagellar biosynthesis/type III secretory pathway M-ring protein FliF/YscJ
MNQPLLRSWTAHSCSDQTNINNQENPTMQNTLFFKIMIVFFALAVPIAIVFTVWRTLFAGLNSITKVKRGNSPEDTAEAEQLQTEQNKSADDKSG